MKKIYQKSKNIHKRKNKINNYVPKDKRKSYTGIFHSTRHGYGFVTCEEFDSDLFVSAKDINRAIEGDTVRIEVKHDNFSDGTSAKVTEILVYSEVKIFATLLSAYVGRNSRKYHAETRYYAVPLDSRFPSEIPVLATEGLEEGHLVEIKLDRHHYSISGRVVRDFGFSDTREANYGAVLAENGIESEFSPEVLAAAEESAKHKADESIRTDLTDKIIFTIDGADAKDLDDAVSLEKNGDGYILGVHIADVSEYVTANTALDRCVMRRGTSVYFTDKVVPMLPQIISNGVCSLNAHEKKYTLSAIINISKEGVITDSVIKRTVIKSHVRGVYSEVNDLFEKGKKSEFYSKYKEVYATLCDMRELYKILFRRSRMRGAIDLDSADAKIVLDENGMPCDVVLCERGDAEKLIEQFMLCANEAVATQMKEENLPTVYRVHEKPLPDKMRNFISFAESRGYKMPTDPKPKDFENILLDSEKKGDGAAMSYLILRTMAKAKYSEKNLGHFGLAIDNYCHFTSPIRRLSDLATHRALKAVLLDGESAAKYTGYVKRAAAAATEGELRALNAEREIEDLYKCLYMENFIGKEFDAKITMVTSFAIFATLDNTCEGMILLSDMGERAIYDEKTLTVYIGAHKYTVADKIRICVDACEITAKKVRFSLVG